MATSKVEIMRDGQPETLIDLTGDTITEETAAEGTTFHDATGEQKAGKMPITNVLYTEQNLTDAQKTQARTNIGAADAKKTDERLSELSEQKVSKTGITLDKDSDGLVYIFIDGAKVGNGVEVNGEIIEGDVIGTLDENNNILLSGALADGTYLLKYENEDGTYTDIGSLVVNTDATVIINLAEPDETATGETAWTSGGWCNSSFIAGSSYAYRSATDGKITTNTIAVNYNDVVYVKGIEYNTGTFPQLAVFDADGNYLKHNYVSAMQNTNSYISELTATDGGDYWSFKNHGSNGHTDTGTRFIRIAGMPSGDISDIVITVNQEIL